MAGHTGSCCDLCQEVYYVCFAPRVLSFLAINLSLPTILSLFLCIVFRRCSSFIVLHVSVQFSQHHLLKRLSFLHCIFLPFFVKDKVPIDV